MSATNIYGQQIDQAITDMTASIEIEHYRDFVRSIANECDHDDGGGVGHIHEPTTGGQQFCAPCRAWRFLNGTPDAWMPSRKRIQEAINALTVTLTYMTQLPQEVAVNAGHWSTIRRLLESEGWITAPESEVAAE